MASNTKTSPRWPLNWTDVPTSEQRRLIRNEKRQRYKTRKMGLPSQPISVEALWLTQNGMCICNECRGHVPLIVGDTVIAHEYFRAGKNSPGHVPANVSLWLSACNSREAAKEKAALRKARRMRVRDNDVDSEETIESALQPDRWNKRFKRKLNGQVVRR